MHGAFFGLVVSVLFALSSSMLKMRLCKIVNCLIIRVSILYSFDLMQNTRRNHFATSFVGTTMVVIVQPFDFSCVALTGWSLAGIRGCSTQIILILILCKPLLQSFISSSSWEFRFLQAREKSYAFSLFKSPLEKELRRIICHGLGSSIQL